MRSGPPAGRPQGGPSEAYFGLRNQVFAVTPAEIGVGPTPAMPTVWGVVMEVGYPEGAYTLVSLADGTTSLYFSTGGGIIGAGRHPAVAQASRSLVAAAEGFSGRMGPVYSYQLPDTGMVKFFVLGYSGTYCAEAGEQALGARRHDLWPLYYYGQEVIARLRELDEGRARS